MKTTTKTTTTKTTTTTTTTKTTKTTMIFCGTIKDLDNLPICIQKDLYENAPDFLDLVHCMDQIEKCDRTFGKSHPEDALRLVNAFIDSDVEFTKQLIASGKSIF